MKLHNTKRETLSKNYFLKSETLFSASIHYYNSHNGTQLRDRLKWNSLFHDNIITVSYIAMQKHIPYSHKSKTKVITG